MVVLAREEPGCERAKPHYNIMLLDAFGNKQDSRPHMHGQMAELLYTLCHEMVPRSRTLLVNVLYVGLATANLRREQSAVIVCQPSHVPYCRSYSTTYSSCWCSIGYLLALFSTHIHVHLLCWLWGKSRRLVSQKRHATKPSCAFSQTALHHS